MHHILTEDRDVPCEVLEWVSGCDGVALVRESDWGCVHLYPVRPAALMLYISRYFTLYIIY